MGIFDIFKKQEENWFNIYSPLNGKVIELSLVPDEAFAQKMIGDGCAIMPQEGSIHAPVEGEIDIFETNHAISFETSNGLEIIVHFGINTVTLKGKGFERIGESETLVKVGDELMKYNLDIFKEKSLSVITPIIITNMDLVEKIKIVAIGDVKVGDLLMKVKLKK